MVARVEADAGRWRPRLAPRWGVPPVSRLESEKIKAPNQTTKNSKSASIMLTLKIPLTPEYVRPKLTGRLGNTFGCSTNKT